MLPFSIKRTYLTFLFLLIAAVTARLPAQCSLLCNTNFENVPNISSVSIIDASFVPCWNTTATDNMIEVWANGFNGVPSFSGNYFVELNAFQVSTLYQNFVTTPGTYVSIAFAHRGRAGVDVMDVSIGPVGGPYSLLGTYSDGINAWGYYTVGYTIPAGFGNNYTLRFSSVSAAGGNPAIGNFLDAITVTLPSSATLSFTTNPILCSGGSNGTVQSSVTNGTGPFLYTWMPSNVHTSTLTAGVGIYTLTVTESNSCMVTGTVQITQNSALTATTTSQNPTCFGSNDGAAQVTASGNVGPYTYTWSPGGANTSSVSPLSPGNYSVQVKSSAGCIITKTLTIAQAGAMTPTVTSVPPSCFGAADGSAQASITGGTGSYTYTWMPSGAYTPTVGALAAGIHTLYVQSSNGCSASKVFTLSNGPVVTMSVTPQHASCFGASDGSAQAVISNAGSYSYTWSPVAAYTQSVSGLASGMYTVNALSTLGCSASATVSINQGPVLGISVSSQSSSCPGAADGSVQATPINGTGPFTYTWMPGTVSTATMAGLTAGIYTVNVQSANGCQGSGTVSVASGPGLSISVASQSTSCFGLSDGSVQASVTGGAGPFTYTWMPGSASSASVAGLAAGTYTVDVLSAGACPASATISVAPGPALNLSVTSQSTSCFGASDGTAQVSPNSGIAPFTYTWTPGSASTSSLSTLVAGIYTVNVTSLSGCAGTETVAVGHGIPLSVSVSSQSTSCLGASDGSAVATITNTAGPFTYTWTPGSASTSSLSALVAGIYTVSVTSLSGCAGTETVAVGHGIPLSVSVSSQSTSCLGASDGSAVATITNTAGPFTYTWTPGSASTSSLSALTAGIYTVNVTSLSGCAGTETVAVGQGIPLSVSVSSQSTSCLGASDGSAVATITNTAGPFTYTWTPGSASTSSLSSLAAGIYTVNARNLSGCAGTGSITVMPGPALSVSITPKHASCFGLSDGEAVAVLNGAGPYSYTWSPAGSSSSSLTALAPGNYTLLVSTTGGCSGAATVAITQPQPVTASIASSYTISCFGASTGSAQVSATGGTAPYAYSWLPAGGAASMASGLPAGMYTCTVEDANRCTGTASMNVVSVSTGTMGVTGANVCEGLSATLSVYGASSYTWLPGNSQAATLTVKAVSSITYTILAKDNQGCLDTLRTTLTVYPKPYVFAGHDTIVNMDEPVTLTGTSSEDFYGWLPFYKKDVLACNYCHQITENPQQKTCYILEAISGFDCRNRDTICVDVTKDWSIYIPNAFTPNKDGVNDLFIPVGYGIDRLELLIFDRWGELIFKSDEEHKGWDGTYRNAACKSDVYVYKVNIYVQDKTEAQRVGKVTLVR